MSVINKILLFGSTGMLGNYFNEYFKDKINLIYIKFRVEEDTLDNLEKLLLDNGLDNATCVINCIGQIPQRKSKEISDKVYFLINSIFPHLLWSICNRYNAKMIQPATDCVFSGRKDGGNYVETDIHDEIGSYGMSKSLGEPLGCTVIRTSIIGMEKNNKKSFLEWVKTSIEEGKEIKGFTNHYWNGITCLEYCRLVENMINTNNFWKGVRHIYSPTSKSKYEIARMIAEVFCEGYNKELIKGIEDIKCTKTLNSNYVIDFEIQELFDQIKELKKIFI